MNALPPVLDRTVGFFAGFVVLTTVVTAQSGSTARAVELSTGYTFTAAGDAEFGGAVSGEIEMSGYRLTASYQRPVSERLSLGLGVNLEQFDLDARPAVPLPDTLRGISVTVTGRWAIDRDWSVVAIAEPGIFTDTEASSSDGFAARGIVAVQRRLSPTLLVGMGLRAASMGDDLILPFPVVRWQPSPAWTVAVGAPRTEVAFAVDRTTTVFAGASVLGGSFAIDDPEIIAPPGHPGLRATELDVREIRIGLGFRRSIGKVRLEVEGGVAVDREYDYYDRDLKIDADAAAFGRINLIAEF